MATCAEQLDTNSVDIGYATKFDQGQGVVYLIGGEACWQEILEKIDEADQFVSEQLQQLEENGINGEAIGLPTYEQYVELRDMVKDYTDGHLLVTSWRWNEGSVTPGHSAGLCLGEPDATSTAYWSCWEFVMEENGEY